MTHPAAATATKPRFKKGQKVYRLLQYRNLENKGRGTVGEPRVRVMELIVQEHTVDTCGMKRVTVGDDTYGQMTKQWHPWETEGPCSTPYLMLHESADAAFAEARRFVSDYTANINPAHTHIFEFVIAEGVSVEP